MKITDPNFKWHGSESHDAGSQPFRRRQLARIRAAEREREQAIATQNKVRPIKQKSA